MTLLVLDAQQLITTERLYRFDAFVTCVCQLIECARRNGVEIVYVRHDDGENGALTSSKPGYDVYDQFCPMPNERIFDKRVNSPFRDTGLLEHLREKGEMEIMLVGLQTDYCMDAAVKCGFEHGFRMIVPEYCHSTFDNAYMTAEQTYRYYHNFMWNGRYADCVSFEDALDMLKRDRNGF